MEIWATIVLGLRHFNLLQKNQRNPTQFFKVKRVTLQTNIWTEKSSEFGGPQKRLRNQREFSTRHTAMVVVGAHKPSYIN